MADRYQFTRSAAQQIQKAVRKSERVNHMPAAPTRHVAQLRVYIAKSPAGGIPALTGSTPGSAEVDLYRIDGDGDLAAITATNKTAKVTAYNLSSSAVAGDTWIHLKQEVASGKMLVDFEDCDGA